MNYFISKRARVFGSVESDIYFLSKEVFSM